MYGLKNQKVEKNKISNLAVKLLTIKMRKTFVPMVAVLNDFAFCLSGDKTFGLHKVMNKWVMSNSFLNAKYFPM